MQKNSVWVPLMTSVGVGAATYYTMTKNHQDFGQAMEKMMPLVSDLNGNKSSQQTMHSGDQQHMNMGGQNHTMNTDHANGHEHGHDHHQADHTNMQ